MCRIINGIHQPCWASPSFWQHQNALQKAAKKKPRSRQSTRAYRTKLQDALLRSSASSTLHKRPNDLLPRPLLTLDASDKLSNHPTLLRDILAKSLRHDNHVSGKPTDQPIWKSLLSILESELPKDNATEPIWTAQEIELIQLPNQLLKGQEEIILHPTWRRFPDAAGTRKLIAEAAMSQGVVNKSPKLMELFWTGGRFRRTRKALTIVVTEGSVS
ncbi:hypothetical protein QC762_0015430 [Podospora pseudocomata]|uniref:Uncharacterized protein n=1 Tax=Podospora pseudocomata TaxID=2093779 RepID=A0ABR0GWF5_9PEZI|nr:hypothetical protein QC762_0015430 [Podospora pseudocomata]